jgi:hypothetical protein
MNGSYKHSALPVNGNGNSTINGRGIKHRDLTHSQLVGLAADAVAGIYPVQPSLGQVPAIFGVTPAEVSAELKRRDAVRKDAEAENALFVFADVWSEQSLTWRVNALRWFSTRADLGDVRLALITATSS